MTEKFRPEPPMRGDYVELLPQYGPLGFNWYDFPHTEWTIGDNVACVQCGEPIRTGYVHGLFERFCEACATEASGVSESVADDVPTTAVEECGSSGAVPDADSCADAGIYDDVEVEDGLLATVLRMTAAGETQVAIAECCGISVYRVRKLQNGELN